jgi:hypothetical protein
VPASDRAAEILRTVHSEQLATFCGYPTACRPGQPCASPETSACLATDPLGGCCGGNPIWRRRLPISDRPPPARRPSSCAMRSSPSTRSSPSSISSQSPAFLGPFSEGANPEGTAAQAG